jgi:hypothetical protein
MLFSEFFGYSVQPFLVAARYYHCVSAGNKGLCQGQTYPAAAASDNGNLALLFTCWH